MRGFFVSLLFVGLTFFTVMGATPNIQGHWALLEISSDYWQVPLVGERQRIGVVIGSIEIEQEGTRFYMEDLSLCGMWLNSGAAIAKVEIPKAFVESVSVGAVPGRIYKEGDRYAIEVPWFVLVNGAELADSEGDLLPTEVDDPRVFDQDDDGHPGVTTKISIIGLISGEAYVVQRVRKSYKGTIEKDGLINGLLYWEDEQNTLDASSSMFAMKSKGRPDPELEHSHFRLVRIDGHESCDDIIKLFADDVEDLI